MSDNLRETILRSAAARFGAEHYRGVLFWHHAKRAAPGFAAAGGLALMAWLLVPAVHFAEDHPDATALGIVTVVALVVAGTLAVRRIRSPYRRRRLPRSWR